MLAPTFEAAAAEELPLNETALRRLAVEPPRRLFPVLAHAAAMWPLVLLLALLPALYSASFAELNGANAWQGLVALRASQAESMEVILDPARGTALAGQPPLSSWLAASLLRLTGPAATAGPIAASLLGVAALVLATSLWARRCGGERAGIVAALFMTANPAILWRAQHAGPASLGAALAVLALVGLLAHWQKSSARWSQSLIAAGIALGACFLCVPLAPLAPLAIGAAASLVRFVNRQLPEEVVHDQSWYPAQTRRFRRTAAVLRMALLGLLAGGWWLIWKSRDAGGEFWRHWASLDGSGVADSPRLETALSLSGPVGLLWPVSGLMALGLWGVLRDLRREPDREHPQRLELLLAGMVASLAGALLFLRERSGISQGGCALQLLLLAPPAVCAALGFVRIIDRQVPPRLIVASAMLTVIAGLGVWWFGRLRHAAGHAPLAGQGVVLPLVGALAVLAWLIGGALYVRRQAQHGDRAPRRVLTFGLCLLALLTSLWGFHGVERKRWLTTELAELQLGLSELNQRCAAVFLVPDSGAPPPAEVEFLVRSRWPRVEIKSALTWDNTPEALPLLSSEPSSDDLVLVTWSEALQVRPEIPANRLRTPGRAYRYRRGELGAYTWSSAEPSP